MTLASAMGRLLNGSGKIDPASKVAASPAFGAYLGSTQTVTNGAWTKVQAGTEEFDTASAYDATTYRFQPTVPGYYQLNGKVLGNGSTSSSSMAVGIYKNGTLHKQGATFISPGGIQSMTHSVSALVYLNGTTDYVELWCQASGSGTITFSAGQVSTWFSGSLATPA